MKNISQKMINTGKKNKQEKVNKELDNIIENIRDCERERKSNPKYF